MNKYDIILYMFEAKIEISLFTNCRRERSAVIPIDCGKTPALLAEVLCRELELPDDCIVKHVICPGGVYKPLKRGIYAIDDRVLEDAKREEFGKHKYNLLTLVCAELAKLLGTAALMYNPLSCDELLSINRMSSIAGIEKKSRYYACEHSAMLSMGAAEIGKRVDDINAVAVWLDDQISVGAHLRGICIDVNDMLGGEGPMGFISSGDVPVAQLAALRLTDSLSTKELTNTLMNKSGLLAYTGTSNPEEIEKLVNATCAEAMLAVEATAYQTAKWIGICTLALNGQVDLIVIGGKGIECKSLVNSLICRVGAIAPISIMDKLDLPTFISEMAVVAGTACYPILKY